MVRIVFSLLILVLFNSCRKPQTNIQFSEKGREIPEFNADSAYGFIEIQVENGPRVPNTEAHALTKDFIVGKLQQYAGKNLVFTQSFEQEVYGETLKLANIIASFNPSATDRIMLSAHWDTRPRADKDPADKVTPIDGADDGASGVGVILELARIFSENELSVGVDVVLFDGEDYGNEGDLDHYFLGSRFWTANPPVPGYNPRFGILLDMVGAEGARFSKEGYSLFYAPDVVREVWQIAAQKGYEEIFPDVKGGNVMDDHYIVAKNARIPMIDIINHFPDKEKDALFPEHWHTHKDNLGIIDKKTLEAVGEVLLELIYNRI